MLLSILTPAAARADWFATPFFGVKFGGSTTIVDLDQAAVQTIPTFGGSVSWLGNGTLGGEAEIAFIPGYFNRESALEPLNKPGGYVLDVSGNVLLAVPADVTGGGIRPYFSVGLGMTHAEAVDLLEEIRIRRSVPTLILGGGATGLLTNRVGVRFDLKYLHSFSRQDEFTISVGRQLSYWRGTIGIAIRF